MYDKLNEFIKNINPILSKELSAFFAFAILSFYVGNNIIDIIGDKSVKSILIVYSICSVIAMVFYIVVLKDMKKQAYTNDTNKAIEELNKLATDLETEIKSISFEDVKKNAKIRGSIKLSGDFIITKNVYKTKIILKLKDKKGQVISEITLNKREP